MKIDKKIQEDIETLCGSVQSLSEVLTELRDEQQDNFDDHTEEWQDSDAGTKAQEEIDELDSLASELEELAERIDNTFD